MIRLCFQQLLHMFFQRFVSCSPVMQPWNINPFRKKTYTNLNSFQHLLLNSGISVSFLNFCRKNCFILVLVVWYVCSLVFTFSGKVFHIGTALLKKPFLMNWLLFLMLIETWLVRLWFLNTAVDGLFSLAKEGSILCVNFHKYKPDLKFNKYRIGRISYWIFRSASDQIFFYWNMLWPPS